MNKEEELLEYLTGTTTPRHLTEREKVMIYKFLQYHEQQNAEYIEALREILAIKESYPVHLPTGLYEKIKKLTE